MASPGHGPQSAEFGKISRGHRKGLGFRQLGLYSGSAWGRDRTPIVPNPGICFQSLKLDVKVKLQGPPLL